METGEFKVLSDLWARLDHRVLMENTVQLARQDRRAVKVIVEKSDLSDLLEPTVSRVSMVPPDRVDFRARSAQLERKEKLAQPDLPVPQAQLASWVFRASPDHQVYPDPLERLADRVRKVSLALVENLER